MSVNYSWEFNPLEMYPTASGYTDVVFKVNWQYIASTGSYSHSIMGSQYIQYISESAFIPFNELTKTIVQGWVESAIGVEGMNDLTLIAYQSLANQINPPTIIQQAPWL